MSDTSARIVTWSPWSDGAVKLADFDNTEGPDDLDWERHWSATAALARALQEDASIERPRLRDEPLREHALVPVPTHHEPTDGEAPQQRASQHAESGFCFVNPWRCRGGF